MACTHALRQLISKSEADIFLKPTSALRHIQAVVLIDVVAAAQPLSSSATEQLP